MRLKVVLGSLLFILTIVVSLDSGLAKSEQENRFDSLKRFSDVLGKVEDNYVRDVDRKELIDGAIKGMLQQLDPHSAYMDKQTFDEMQVNTSGEFSGIGIEISIKNGRLVVVSPIEDTPADKAGLKSGDAILEIDGETTQDISLSDAVAKIRGQRGSEVVLTVLHKNSKTPERVSIIRDTIPIVSVKSELLENGVVYLRLTRFNEHTTVEMRAALKKYQSKDQLKGLILDLRNNPGGLLDQAVSVAETFLSEGLVVYIKGRSDASKKDFAVKPGHDVIKAPMVVLINVGSASASEIVAGALQDHKRALLLGEPSFGKGSVQTIMPLADGAGMKLTTALYYTPSGRSIQAEGIKPDLHIPLAVAEATEEGLTVMREKDLSGHLENGQDKKDKKKRPRTAPATPTTAEKIKTMLEKDNQLRLALRIVKMPQAVRDALQ